MELILEPPEITPTKEQLEAIECDKPRLAVLAAAGTGKTAVLVRRYLKHVVEEGRSPDSILTITFTRKAAAEMKTRIVKRLRALDLMKEAQIAETGPIQTIHSFCERLLRENALEAGLDPGFEVLDESEASRILERCIREIIASPLDGNPHAEKLLRVLAGKRTRPGTNGQPSLESALHTVLSELRGSARSLEEVQRDQTEPDALKELCERQMLASMPEGVQEAFPSAAGDTFRARLLAAHKAAGVKAPQYVAARADEAAEAESLVHTSGLLYIACEAWSRLEREMERTQRMDFNALEARAVRLLDRSDITIARLKKRYSVVMVDEAQDVNPMQHRLISAMNLDCEMIVGDAQQSIYGFRQADIGLFELKANASEKLRLSQNHRSEQGILNFVNLVFGHFWPGYIPMTKEKEPLDLNVVELPTYPGVEIWESPFRSIEATSAFVKELLEEGEVERKETTILVRGSFFATNLQLRLEAEGIPARIAGGSERFYARLEIRDLANVLRALGDPYDDYALLAALRSPVAGISLDSIAMLAQNAPVVEALEGFEPPVPEDVPILEAFKAWYTPLRGYADRLSAWEVLSELFASSGYLEALARRRNGDQLLANVRKLLTLAAKEPDLGPVEYAERIREIQGLRHKEGDAPAGDDDADVVTIMTIHKSKGLEFPVVILPDMHYPLSGRTDAVVADARMGVAATRLGKSMPLFSAWLQDVRKKRDLEEELRVLYVAMTRAQRRLCITLGASNKDNLAAKVARAINLEKGSFPGALIRASKERP